MASDAALQVVNQLKMQLAGMVREVITDFADGRLSAPESVSLAMHGVVFASSLAAVLQRGNAAMRVEVLDVLEHGQLVMPSEGGRDR